MSLQQWLALAGFGVLSFAVSAQDSPAPDPADAGASVAAPRYESAFTNYQSAEESNQTPDQAWRSANDEMARLGGHAGHARAAAADSAAPSPGPAKPAGGQQAAPAHHHHAAPANPAFDWSPLMDHSHHHH